MKSTNSFIFAFAAVVSALFCMSVQAQQTLSSPFGGIDSAQQICGPKITPEDLRGKIVFVEYWGTHCGPCRQSMPHLQEMYSQFEKTGLFCIIGNHIQPYSADTESFLKKTGVTFPVYQQLNLPINQPITSIPHAFLFDASGRMIAQGHPMELVKSVPTLIQLASNKSKTESGNVVASADNVKAPVIPEEIKNPVAVSESNIPQDSFSNIYSRNNMTGKATKFSKGGFQRSFRGGRF